MTRSTTLHDVPITFIGAGAMGEAMIGGLRQRGLVLDSPRAKLRDERGDKP